MPVINGVYTKDFPALGRAPIDTDIIPIAEVANQITFKTTIGEIFNAKVFGTAGAIPKFTSGNTLGDSIITELSDKIGIDIATPNNKLSINSTDPGSGLDLQIGSTSYARFGIINPGVPGEPGVDNDCFIGSTINNDFLVRTNNIEALRIDTAQRLTIANIQNALADTDKFLVSEGGVVKYRSGSEVLADIGAQGAITLTTSGSSGASTLIGNTLNIPNYSPDLSGYVTLNTAQTITAAKTFTTSGGSNTLVINHSSGSGIALSITKGGNGEGIYVNKTSGSGNAVTIIGTLNATTLVKNGGTSSQFLKADGSVDSTAYGTGSVTSVAALTLGTSGTDLNSSVANGTTTPVITLNVPDASATNRGVITTGTQTIAGTKTFSVDAVVNGINIGRGGGSIATNTRVGTTALNLNSTGSGNTALGNNAMFYNTTGSNNTAIGSSALVNNTTGNSNVAIGITAGSSTNAGAFNQLSSNSVYIGYGAYASASGNTNEIVIGEGSRGGGSNSATLGNTSINTTILHGNTSIGYTTNPSLYKLDVNGTGRFSGELSLNTNTNYILWGTNSAVNPYIQGSSDNSLYIGTGNAPRLTIASTGAATFSTNDITQNGTRPILSLQQSGTTKAFWGISSGASDLVTGDSSGDAVFRKPASSGAFRWSVDGGSSSALVLASTGAATFSSSVTATSFLKTGPGEWGTFNDTGSGASSQSYYQNYGTDSSSSVIRWYVGQNAFRTDGSFAIQNTAGTGLYLTTGNTSWTSTSDEKSKDIIRPITNALNDINSWRTVVGKYKNDDIEKERLFLIAQDILLTTPQVVDVSDEGNLGLRYLELIPVLVKAIQELSEKITQLENK
jgi:hypothetical protein